MANTFNGEEKEKLQRKFEKRHTYSQLEYSKCILQKSIHN